MGHENIDYYSYQRPCLLWIPAPVAAPGFIGPDGTQECSYSEEIESEGKGLIVDLSKFVEGLAYRPEVQFC